jgi:hypothetical protein
MSALDEIERLENGTNALEIFGPGWHKRQSPNRVEKAHLRKGGFDGDGIRFDEVDVHEREVAIVEAAGFGKITGARGLDKASHFRGDFVGRDGNEAVPTKGNEREGERVVTGEDEKIARDLA